MHGDSWVWRYQQEHAAGMGLSAWTLLRTHRFAGHQDPWTSTCGFTRYPDLETKNGGDLTIHRGGRGWRHWSLPDPKGYKNAYWKCTDPERNSGDPRKSWQFVLLVLHVIAMDPGSIISTQALWCLAAGLMLGHQQYAAAHDCETESMNRWKHFVFQFVF